MNAMLWRLQIRLDHSVSHRKSLSRIKRGYEPNLLQTLKSVKNYIAFALQHSATRANQDPLLIIQTKKERLHSGKDSTIDLDEVP
jgi:hypothetical protein